MASLSSGQLSELISELPKVELHLHLDGSLTPAFLMRHLPSDLNAPEESKIRQFLVSMKEKHMSKFGDHKVMPKTGNMMVFDVLNSCLQSKEQLYEATVQLLEHLRTFNIVYAELRFCPKLHTLQGITERDAIEAVIKGFKSQTAIKGGIILCAVRTLDSTRSHCITTAKLAKEYLGKGVLGMDLAGNERGTPLNSPSDPTYDGIVMARELSVPITLHAGEWPSKNEGQDNLRFAINHLKAQRIGHAIAMHQLERSELEQFAKERSFTVEVCLTSNLAKGFKWPSFSTHPVKLLLEHKIPFTLSSDNLLLSGDSVLQASPNNELLHLVEDVIGTSGNWSRAVKFSLMCGARAAFNTSDVNDEWIRDFEERIDAVFEKYHIPRSKLQME